jgi:hypothetical protein
VCAIEVYEISSYLKESSMSLTKVAVIAAMFVSTAAAAQTVAPAAPAPAPVKEKKICRSEVPLGSIMTKRVCMTRSEWAAIRARDNAAAAGALDQAHRGSGGMSQTAN